jgi:hypothetical protein
MPNNILTEISNNQLIGSNIEQQLIINEVISDINIENQDNLSDIYPPYVTRQKAFCTNIDFVNMVSF